MTDNPLRAWAQRHQRAKQARQVQPAAAQAVTGRGRRADGRSPSGGPAGAGDAAAIGKQDAGVLERYDAVAGQAPYLFGMRRHDVGRLAI
jgi:hypothetical protein